MKKLYLATLILISCSALTAMNNLYVLPHQEVIKDRLQWKIGKHFGEHVGNHFIATTNIHTPGQQAHKPLSITMYAESAANNFCSQTMDKEKAINIQPELKHIIIYKILRDYPRAIEALQNNYNLLPKKIKNQQSTSIF